MVNYSEHVWIDEDTTDFILLWLLEKLHNVLDSEHPDVKIAFLKHLDMLFEVLCRVFLCHIEFVGHQLDYLLDLGILLQSVQEHKLNVLVAL